MRYIMNPVPSISDIKYTLGNTLVETFRTDNTILNIIIAMIIGRVMLLMIGALEGITQLIHKLWNSLFRRVTSITHTQREFASSLSFVERQDVTASGIQKDTNTSTAFCMQILQHYISTHPLESDTGHFTLEDGAFRTQTGAPLLDLGRYQIKFDQLIRLTDEIWIKGTRSNAKITDQLNEINVTLTLYSYQPITHIQDFIRRIHLEYNRYKTELHCDQNKYFLLHECNSRGYNEELIPQFTCHILDNQKTFDHLYFPDREQIVRMIQHFMQKTGIFGKPVVPHKLGFLLYGVPGCGKTLAYEVRRAFQKCQSF